MPKLDLSKIPVRGGTGYPPPHDEAVRHRTYQRLADAAGLTGFGANRVILAPGAWSSQRHWHSHSDEFLVMLEGDAVLIDDDGEHPMAPGDFAAFKAGDKNGNHLVNRTNKDAVFLVIGSHHPDDSGGYPDIDMQFLSKSQGGGFAKKNGEPF
jgi:uncharacterized cupin superfamily protein